MLGKIIADYIGLTEKLGENKNQKYKEIEKIDVGVKVDETEWDKFQQEVKAADGDTIKIKAAIDDSELQQLKNLDGLYDYAVEQSKAGKDVDLGSVNKLIQTQNFNNIANQAHGFRGVNTAIKEYKKLTDEASKSKFAETISGTNAKLGAYLTNLNGATAGMGGYIKSLVTSTLKSFALEAATMALNAAMSLGASLIISGIASCLTDLFTSTERLQERAEGFTISLDEMNEKFSKGKKTISELSKQYERLSKGVDKRTHCLRILEICG